MSVHPGRNCKESSAPVWFLAGRIVGVIAVLVLVVGAIDAADQPTEEPLPIVSSEKYPGYQSLWYSHTPVWKGEVIPGRSYEYGPKQGGGLGTYQAVHIPRTIYAPEVQKTFFAYGGTKQDQRHLLAMASYFDHRTGLVPQPTIVHDKQGVDDAHDNPVITLDEQGHVWVFVAGRSRHRPGFIYRSIEPYSTDAFQRLFEGEFAYPQPWWIKGQGFLWLHTRYTRGRELYFATSPDGRNWSQSQKLAGMRGHYQVSNARDDRVFTAFSWHPGGNVDRRTNLYYLEPSDMGLTWQTAAGQTVQIPLGDDDVHGAALVHGFQAEERLVYVNDIQLDSGGHPVVVMVTSTDHRPGPYGNPRSFTVHSYVRRPVDAAEEFYAMWADGNWYTYTRSYLYFTNRQGDRVWRLPYAMDQTHASPELMECWSDP